jgi:2-polyprenyl-3-methyl-5-hydroxy-6-metoxy-1,4-benzoquinol methylase
LDNDPAIYKDYFIKQINREKDNPLSYSRVYYWWRKTRIITSWLSLIIKEQGNDVHIYDIGCGDAMRLAHILTHLEIQDTVNYNGFDLNQKQLQIAQARFEICNISHFIFEKANITEGIPRDDNSADIIISIEVLEHLRNPQQLLKETFRLLKLGGTAIFTTPNKRNLLDKTTKFFRNQRQIIDEEDNRKEDEEGFGHISIKPLPQWLALANREGFVTVDAKYGSFLFGTKKLNNHPVLFAVSIFAEKLLSFLPKQLQTGEDALFMLRKS